MANEIRVRSNFVGGLVDTADLSASGTTLNSAGLAAIPVAIGSTNHMAITLDPDGLYGAPEIAYITALTLGATSCTLSRGQEGTTARQHLMDTPWVHAPTTRDFGHGAIWATRTGGNVTVSSTTWAAVDTGLDLTLAAQAGDIIEYGVNGAWAGTTSTTVYGLLDAATVVGGSVVNYFSSGSSSPATYGTLGWWGPPYTASNSPDFPIPGPIQRTLVSGDLSGGNVTLRLQTAISAAGSRLLYAATTTPLRVFARNLGPQVA